MENLKHAEEKLAEYEKKSAELFSKLKEAYHLGDEQPDDIKLGNIFDSDGDEIALEWTERRDIDYADVLVAFQRQFVRLLSSATSGDKDELNTAERREVLVSEARRVRAAREDDIRKAEEVVSAMDEIIAACDEDKPHTNKMQNYIAFTRFVDEEYMLFQALSAAVEKVVKTSPESLTSTDTFSEAVSDEASVIFNAHDYRIKNISELVRNKQGDTESQEMVLHYIIQDIKCAIDFRREQEADRLGIPYFVRGIIRNACFDEEFGRYKYSDYDALKALLASCSNTHELLNGIYKIAIHRKLTQCEWNLQDLLERMENNCSFDNGIRDYIEDNVTDQFRWLSKMIKDFCEC